jgi:SAM-dependent methyltransferase
MKSTIYRHPRHYDALAGDYANGPELGFYSRLAAVHQGPLLELGAGTGRLSLALAGEGLKVTGVEIDGGMLSLARLKAAERQVEVEWVEADARTFSLDQTFPLVVLPNNTIAHFLDRESVEALFAAVRRHLAPGGRFVVDYFNPLLALLTRDQEARVLVSEYYDPDGRGLVRVTESSRYDAASQVNHLIWYYRRAGEEHEESIDLAMRVYFPQELVDLLHYNGFTVESRFGSFDQAPFNAESFQHLLVCRVRD